MGDNKSAWEKEELPGLYLKLEGILYQTAWMLKEELKKQQKQADKARAIVEQEIGSQKK